LAHFIFLLRENLKNNSAEWENATLDSFLEALEAYVKDIHGYYQNNKIAIDIDSGNPPWRFFADVLRGAMIYE